MQTMIAIQETFKHDPLCLLYLLLAATYGAATLTVLLFSHKAMWAVYLVAAVLYGTAAAAVLGGIVH